MLTKRVGKVDIVDVDECDCTPPSRLIVGQTGAVPAKDAANDRQRDARPSGTGHQQRATANLVDEEQRGQRAQAIDDTVDACSKERCGVAAHTQLTEDGWCVVDHS